MTHQRKTNKPQVHNIPQQEAKPKLLKKPLLLPVAVVFFLLVWLWAAWWYGCVFRIAREFSFWAPDATLMYYMQGRPWGMLWQAGLALLQLFRYPILGGSVMALFVSGSAWLLGYCLRLRGWWRLLQYLPSAAYLFTITYIGFDLYYEAETGMIMGIPLACFIVLLILALIIRSFSHHHTFPNIVQPPKDETPWQNRIQILFVIAIIASTIELGIYLRPYVRVVTKMQCQMMRHDWRGMTKTALDNTDLSYRQIAAYYAIALVQLGEQGEHFFDIRLDYDDPYIHGFNRRGKKYEGLSTVSSANYYMMECDFYAGLFQTSLHHAMENLTMSGPNLRSLKMLTKCALVMQDWRVAEKYLRILQKVPFESDFVNKYSAMLYHSELVDTDPEFAIAMLTEPMHDYFENFFIHPVFLGYNASLVEGRSINALWNSIMVNIYSKTMPQFLQRCAPMRGTTPPKSIAEALMMMSYQNPEILREFSGLEFHRDKMFNFIRDTNHLLSDFNTRSAHARELFPKYRGYYPYYYYFGNLKATRRSDTDEKSSSNQGVN